MITAEELRKKTEEGLQLRECFKMIEEKLTTAASNGELDCCIRKDDIENLIPSIAKRIEKADFEYERSGRSESGWNRRYHETIAIEKELEKNIRYICKILSCNGFKVKNDNCNLYIEWFDEKHLTII